MRKFLIVVLIVLSLFQAQAQRPPQKPVSDKIYTPEQLGYSLVWNDEFDETQLDTTKWRVRGVGPRAIAYVSEKAVKVEDGLLKLYALNENDTLFGSAVGTQGLFMSKYGWYECRAQVQKSPGGVWAAFWIQSTDIAKGEDPAIYGAEIDIIERRHNFAQCALGVRPQPAINSRLPKLFERSGRGLSQFCT
jgi:hypothetical protein